MNFEFFSHMLMKFSGGFWECHRQPWIVISVTKNTDANVFMAKGISIFSKRWQKKWPTLITFSTVITAKMDFEIEIVTHNDSIGFILIVFQFYVPQTTAMPFPTLICCRCFHSWCVISFYLSKYFVILSVNRHAVRWLLLLVVASDSYHVSSFQS